MATQKLFIFERFLLVAVLGGSIWGFWYFEENLLLRIFVVALAFSGIILAFSKKPHQAQFSSKNELLVLLILYLGLFSLYNLLYGLNIPLYVVMIAILGLVSAMLFSLLSLDEIDKIMGKSISNTFIILMDLAILEVFLSLYFWPIDPEAKSLIIVVIFYLIISLIYLYVHSMLKLRKIVGYLTVSLIILTVLLLIIWHKFRQGGAI